MLAVFACRFDLLRDAAILLFPTGVAAVDDDMGSRRQRAIVAGEVQITTFERA